VEDKIKALLVRQLRKMLLSARSLIPDEVLSFH
jgi:hypothetical protein